MAQTLHPQTPHPKASLRDDARLRRDALAGAAGSEAPHRLAEHFLADVAPVAGTVVAGYWPKGSEIDCRPLLECLYRAACVCALPSMIGAGRPLLFRRWTPGIGLEPGPFGVMEPPASAAVLSPAVVIVPLLAFDASRHRLGYGGGYYDRTLEALRRAGTVLAVGVAFAGQEVARLPSEGHDEVLDRIVTEEGVLR